MLDCFKCPLCANFYNSAQNSPMYSECGGVCCKTCTANPCAMCQKTHTVEAADYLHLQDYLNKIFIPCICRKQTAVFIDGKTFLPYCETCKKSYQKGVKIDEDCFKTFINSILWDFVEKLRKIGSQGLLRWVLDRKNRELSDKLVTIRLVNQFLEQKVYCEVHLDKLGKYMNEKLQFFCDCGSGAVKLQDKKECKKLVESFVSGLRSRTDFLHDQVYGKKKFFPVQAAIEAKSIQSEIRFWDICNLCKESFLHSQPYEVTCVSAGKTCVHIACEECCRSNKCSKDENGILSNPIKLNVNFPKTCANCNENFIVIYGIPFEEQPLVPYELVCEHNICKLCADKTCEGVIKCKICSQCYRFDSKLNEKFFISKFLYCPIHLKHKLRITTYAFTDTLLLMCEKCEKFEKYEDQLKFAFVDIATLSYETLENLISFLSAENKLSFEISNAYNKLRAPKHDLECISIIYKSLEFLTEDQIELVDQKSIFSIVDFMFSFNPSRSVMVTSIEFVLAGIEGKLKFSRYANGGFQIFKCFNFKLELDSCTFDLKPMGYLPLAKGLYYELHAYKISAGFNGCSLVKNSTSLSGLLDISIYTDQKLDNSFSLIKSFNFKTIS